MEAQDGTTVFRYYVRGDNGKWNDGWALFLIDSTGYFSCVSDYGNYAFRWTHFGDRDFRKFLVGLNPDYLLSKISKKEFDPKGTERAIKEHIIERRRASRCIGSTGMSKEKAREEWDLLVSLEVDQGIAGYVMWSNETALEDAWECYTQDYPSEAWAFANKVWPRFAKVLREELEKAS